MNSEIAFDFETTYCAKQKFCSKATFGVLVDDVDSGQAATNSSDCCFFILFLPD